jgi:thiamine-phosphate pyrophosphorylase
MAAVPAPVIAGYYAILDVRASAAGTLAPAASDKPDHRLAGEVARARELLAAGPCVLQLRAKRLCDRDLLALARALLPLCRAAGVPLCLNDRPDLAHLVGADLVHVGQEDLPLADVRRVQALLWRGTPVGVSTHNLAQVEAAVAAGADYIGFGPVFTTASKDRPDPVVGLEGLRAVAARVRLPVVAIGGITRASVGAVIAAGAAAAAVIGDIDTSSDRTGAARAVAAAFTDRDTSHA